jgi:glycosyltransferase involved in cell wall biosynthesis
MLKCIASSSPIAFIMPHRRFDNTLSKTHLDEAVKSIGEQTDKNWFLIIIDDCSPNLQAREYLQKVKTMYPQKIHLLFNEGHLGAGASRNRGIKYAASLGASAVIFNDTDDISNPNRLEVIRENFSTDPEANVVYSTFVVINEKGVYVDERNIALTIKEILNGHKSNVVNGYNSWIPIATEKNYTNLTSSTAAKIELACQEPFYSSRVSEDAHTWLRYGACDGKFVYNATIPSLYRIWENTESSSRERNPNFYDIKAETDTHGFFSAMAIAEDRNKLHLITKKVITIKFYIKLAESLLYGRQVSLAEKILRKARDISHDLTQRFITQYGIEIQGLYR